MKLIYAGTPPFASAALTALRDAGHDIALVLTQPDRPAGRGMKLNASAVAIEAKRLGLRLENPPNLKDPAVHAMLREVDADAMIVAAYGLLLPQAVLEIPKYGCINIHGSLLPRWRGAAPVQRAIEAGDKETGIVTMQMDVGLDTGAILLEKKIAIAPDETSTTLFEKLTQIGATAIVETLKELSVLVPLPQPTVGVTYANKISKVEARIDWNQPAIAIERRVRAFDPFPGCETIVGSESIKIWRAQVVDNGRRDVAPGTVIRAGQGMLAVQCGEQQLQWTMVQKAGGKRMMIDNFLRANFISEGIRLS